MKNKISNIITTVILVLLIVLVTAMFIARASGNSLSLFGFSVFRVSSDSMEPTLMVGDIILVKSAPAEQIEKGDIVTYKAEQGAMRGERITHRVVTDPVVREGSYYYQTQGDAEGATLDPEISYRQVVGKYVGKIPFLDKIYSFFLTPFGLIAIIVVILGLFGYEIISLIVSYKAIDSTYEEMQKSVEEEAQSKKEQEDEQEE